MAHNSNIVRNSVKAIIAQQGWSLTNVVNAINERHPERKKTTVQNISNKLSRGTIKYSEILEIADIIGVRISFDPINHSF